MYIFVLVVVALVSGLRPTEAVTCQECVDNYKDGLSVHFCGTDLQNYAAYSQAFDNNCFDQCGVMTYTAGTCGCPNDCSVSVGQGSCGQSGTCVCAPGWGGQDCSMPVVGNTCSLHGKLVEGGSKNALFPFDYCDCDDGFTGTDCRSETLPTTNAPWGTLFNSKVYTSADTYKDAHPVWNISVLAKINIEIDVNDYIFLLQPWNLYNETYAKATIHFDNGNLRQTVTDVGFRVKGASSRQGQKKGWMIKFNEFVKGQKLLDISKLGLKPGSQNDDTLLKTMLYTDFSRAMGVPVQRASYALLYINKVFAGVYFMHEDFAPTFIDTRLSNDDGSGNTMKLFYNVNLQYFGSDLTYYKNKVHVNSLGVPMNYYEQTDGNGDWTDFVDWLYFFNSTSDSDFAAQVESRVEVQTLLKQLVVESFMLATDNLASGQNYYTYHRQSVSAFDGTVGPVSSSCQQWQIIEFDFDECFAWDSVTRESEADLDIFGFFVPTPSTSYENRNPLFYRVLVQPKYTAAYLNNYQLFLDSVFGSSSAQQPSQRYASYLQLLAPWVERDLLWQYSFGITYDEFVADAQRTVVNLNARYQDTYAQVQQYKAAK